jgi:hypothetical protein
MTDFVNILSRAGRAGRAGHAGRAGRAGYEMDRQN